MVGAAGGNISSGFQKLSECVRTTEYGERHGMGAVVVACFDKGPNDHFWSIVTLRSAKLSGYFRESETPDPSARSTPVVNS